MARSCGTPPVLVRGEIPFSNERVMVEQRLASALQSPVRATAPQLPKAAGWLARVGYIGAKARVLRQPGSPWAGCRDRYTGNSASSLAGLGTFRRDGAAWPG